MKKRIHKNNLIQMRVRYVAQTKAISLHLFGGRGTRGNEISYKTT